MRNIFIFELQNPNVYLWKPRNIREDVHYLSNLVAYGFIFNLLLPGFKCRFLINNTNGIKIKKINIAV